MPIGVYNHKKGYKHSEETKRKIGKANAIALLGRKNGPMSEETKKKIGLANSIVLKGRFTGRDSPNWKGGYERKIWHNKERRARKYNNGGSHTLEQWQELKKKYNYMCLCCKQFEPEIKLSEDHVVPLKLGGKDDISNIQPLCTKCNSRKKLKIIKYEYD